MREPLYELAMLGAYGLMILVGDPTWIVWAGQMAVGVADAGVPPELATMDAGPAIGFAAIGVFLGWVLDRWRKKLLG